MVCARLVDNSGLQCDSKHELVFLTHQKLVDGHRGINRNFAPIEFRKRLLLHRSRRKLADELCQLLDTAVADTAEQVFE